MDAAQYCSNSKPCSSFLTCSCRCVMGRVQPKKKLENIQDVQLASTRVLSCLNPAQGSMAFLASLQH